MAKIELEVLEFLCSKLCHDLVGPVGAINNGVELLADPGLAADEDILPLIESSARSARHRLDFFRIAFGFGGGRSGWRVADLRQLLANMLADGRVELDWPADLEADSEEVSARAAKLLLNLGAIGAEAMPRGGRLSFLLAFDGERLDGTVTAEGQGAGLREEIRAILSGNADPAAPDARSVQAHFAMALAGYLGATVAVEEEEGRATIALRVPSVRANDFIGR